jgi:hypothetical protein
VITAAILAGVIFAAVMVSILVLIRIGMNREHGRYLSSQAPGRLAGATRAVAGLHVIRPGPSVQVLSPPGLDGPDARAPATDGTNDPEPSNGARHDTR